MSHHRTHQKAVAREVAGQVSFHVARQFGRGSLRVGDVERDDAAHALGEHYAVGRLDRAEYDERLEAVFSARTQGDLMAVFRDLPQSRPALAPRPAPPAPRGPHVPFLPVMLLLVGVSVLAGAAWVFWIGLGGLLLARKAAHDRRRRARQASGSWRPPRGSWA